MARVCMRPGCDRLAVARLTYDTISCEVWLDDVLGRPAPVQELCELHASRLTVPRGWTLLDRRGEHADDAAPAEPPPAEPALVEPVADRVRVDAITSPAATVSVTVAASAAVESPTEPQPVVARAAEPRIAQTVPVAAPTEDTTVDTPREPEQVEAEPVAAAAVAERADAELADLELADEPEEPDDELPESLQATSPLLARAFSTTGHQRSVLTQTLADHDR